MDTKTKAHIIDYVERDDGQVPCSRYVPRSGTGLGELTLAVQTIITEATGEDWTYESLDNIAGLIVNDSDDIARIIYEHGWSAGINPHDYLDPDVLITALVDSAEETVYEVWPRR